jgi:Arc/MetJ-type ribon-helix-helix transcriptional regulator
MEVKMLQAKFSIGNEQAKFIENYKEYGFKDKSELVRKALNLLKKEVEENSLRQSAELYAQIYEEEQETRELTEAAIEGWPE